MTGHRSTPVNRAFLAAAALLLVSACQSPDAPTTVGEDLLVGARAGVPIQPDPDNPPHQSFATPDVEFFEVCKRWIGTAGTAVFDVEVDQDRDGTVDTQFQVSTATDFFGPDANGWSCRDVWVQGGLGGIVRVTEQPISGYSAAVTAASVGPANTVVDQAGRSVSGLASGGASGGVIVHPPSGVTAFFENTEALCSIGDYVWEDSNFNGIQDAGEAGIPGVKLNLLDAGGTVVAMTTTDANGFYLFSGLSCGDYSVQLDLNTVPAGLLPTTVNAGADPTIDSNPNPSSTTVTPANPDDLTLDFGFTPTPLTCAACKGGVTSITLRYTGGAGDAVTFDLDNDESATQLSATTWLIQHSTGDKIGDFDIFVNGQFDTNIHTSCSQPVDPGLTYGSFEILAGVSKDGGPICPLGDCAFDAQAPKLDKDKIEWDIKNTAQTTLSIESVEIGWPEGGPLLDKVKLDGDIYTTDTPAPTAGSTLLLGLGDFVGAVKNRSVKPGDTKRLTLEWKAEFDVSQVFLHVTFVGGAGCELRLDPTAPPPGGGGLSCADGKPQVLTMRYTGQDCSVMSHNQDSGKVVCTGDAAFTDPVFFKAGDKDDPNDADADRFGSGVVALNGLFDIDATLDGENRLKSATNVHLFSASTMALLGSIEFHTSCSQPLAVGDQFGPMIIEAWVPEP